MVKRFLSILFLSFTLLNCTNNMEAIRGVWLTNVDSDALNSKENIISTVDLCDQLGFNTIFVVTWNKAMTTYPSKIMKEFTGVEIDTQFVGRDPLKELIDEAHKKDIKVIAWFEFGFSSSFEENGGILINKKPEWASKNVDGNLVQKNGFEWMNGFNPEVQDFLLSIIMEVVQNYNVDGIQGDDRLPAMPSEAGYDDFTINLYKESHNGNEPPKDFRDENWVQWRADLLNDFMAKIHSTVKNYNENILVTMAPSLYSWSKEEYLQDWPTWVEKGYVDLIIPQAYRYEIERYDTAIDEIVNQQISKENLKKFYPGILLKVGDYYAPEEYLKKAIEINRKYGINGEVYFFYEGVKRYKDFFIDIYKDKVEFPRLVN